MSRLALYILPASLLLAVGCVAPPVPLSLPAPRPLGEGLGAYASPRPASVDEPTGTLTLRGALSQALVRNPELGAASWDVRAAEARALQASLRPNPELEVEAEEIARESGSAGLAGAEASLVLSQVVELGGKRAKRVRVAQLDGELAGWDYETKRLEVFSAVAEAFIEVLAAQERAALADDMARLAERGYQTVAAKVKAGKEAPVEEDKARVELAASRIELAQAKRALAARRRALAALWGSRSATFSQVNGQLDALAPVPPAEQLTPLLAQNPDVARWAAELRQREAALALEEASRVPDVTLSGGVAYFNETDDGAFIVGVGLPLPLVDRNQGGIAEARAKLAKAREEQRAAEVRAHTELGEACEELASSHEEASALKAEVLPAAQRAFDAAQEGYRQGKFGYLEVLDAQRTLFEARQKLIEALASYHSAVASVERLVGRTLTSASTHAN